MTQKEKLASFDQVAAERDKLQLALHDVVNGKMSAAVRINLHDYDKDWAGGYYQMRMSPRPMPLFVVRYVVSCQDDQVEVWTDAEIQDRYQAFPTATGSRMLMVGRSMLMEKYKDMAAK